MIMKKNDKEVLLEIWPLTNGFMEAFQLCKKRSRGGLYLRFGLIQKGQLGL
jgi:hypothetical protein